MPVLQPFDDFWIKDKFFTLYKERSGPCPSFLPHVFPTPTCTPTLAPCPAIILATFLCLRCPLPPSEPLPSHPHLYLLSPTPPSGLFHCPLLREPFPDPTELGLTLLYIVEDTPPPLDFITLIASKGTVVPPHFSVVSAICSPL